MKTSRLSACLLLTLLLLCCLMPAAFAEVVFSSEEGSLTGTYDATVFQAGQDATSNAEVKGILFMAGRHGIFRHRIDHLFLDCRGGDDLVGGRKLEVGSRKVSINGQQATAKA